MGDFLSAQLSELWALWPKAGFVSSVCERWCTAMHSSDAFPLSSSIVVSLSLVGDTHCTLSPFVAQTMQCRCDLLVHPCLALVSLLELSQRGFDGWESLLGACISVP